MDLVNPNIYFRELETKRNIIWENMIFDVKISKSPYAFLHFKQTVGKILSSNKKINRA